MSEQVDHEAAKRLAEARLLADMHPSSGDKNLSRAYLDLDAQLEAANERADELQSRVDTVTASHCEMLRELQAERHRVDRLVELVTKGKRPHYYCEDSWYSCPKADGGCCDDSYGDECNCGADDFNSKIDTEITAIMEDRDNG